jgi:hypothetical protein
MAIRGSGEGEIPVERGHSQLTLTIDAGYGADEEDRTELARRLRQEFLRADIDARIASSTSLSLSRPSSLPQPWDYSALPRSSGNSLATRMLLRKLRSAESPTIPFLKQSSLCLELDPGLDLIW